MFFWGLEVLLVGFFAGLRVWWLSEAFVRFHTAGFFFLWRFGPFG